MAEIRNMSSQESTARLGQALDQWMVSLDVATFFKTCASCSNLAEDGKTCTIHNAIPPARVVVKGCDQYNDAHEIPDLV